MPQVIADRGWHGICACLMHATCPVFHQELILSSYKATAFQRLSSAVTCVLQASAAAEFVQRRKQGQVAGPGDQLGQSLVTCSPQDTFATVSAF